MTVRVDGVSTASGVVMVCLWKEPATGFPDCGETEPFKRVAVRASKGSVSVTLGDVAPGKYAISVLHDLDENGKTDTNFLGIPTEPVGVSGKPPSFGPPRFSESRFDHTGSPIAISLMQ